MLTFSRTKDMASIWPNADQKAVLPSNTYSDTNIMNLHSKNTIISILVTSSLSYSAAAAEMTPEAVRVQSKNAGIAIGRWAECNLDTTKIRAEIARSFDWCASVTKIQREELSALFDSGVLQGRQAQRAEGNGNCVTQSDIDNRATGMSKVNDQAIQRLAVRSEETSSAMATITSNSSITRIDGTIRLPFSSNTVEVKAGWHTVELGGACASRGDCTFRLKTVQDLTYQIEVSPRFFVKVTDHAGVKVDELVLNGAGKDFIPRSEKEAIDQEVRNRQEREAQQAKQNRIANAPLVRKIGARICQPGRNGLVYVGYVERIADEKVQIRVVEAIFPKQLGARLADFQSSIIWDHPENWDLCE